MGPAFWSVRLLAAPRSMGPAVFSWAHRQPTTHIWSLLECAAPGRSSHSGTRGFPGLTANPQHIFGPSWSVRLLAAPRSMGPAVFPGTRIAAVQSRVAAPVVSDPRPPPPVPAFSPFRDGHYWCSKCPRKGFTTIPGLMRHITHQHAGSTVDESTCSLFTAIERVTCTAPACGGLRRVGARVCNRCGQASQARTPLVGDIIMGPLGVSASGEDTGMVDADVTVTPSLTAGLPSLTCRATSRSAFARFPRTPSCTFLPAVACA